MDWNECFYLICSLKQARKVQSEILSSKQLGLAHPGTFLGRSREWLMQTQTPVMNGVHFVSRLVLCLSSPLGSVSSNPALCEAKYFSSTLLTVIASRCQQMQPPSLVSHSEIWWLRGQKGRYPINSLLKGDSGGTLLNQGL